jgi:hypothetical protein
MSSRCGENRRRGGLPLPGSQQDRPCELKGGGHLLGETAEHFFSEGVVGQLLRACESADWKVVKQLARAVDPASKPNAEDICAKATFVQQQTTSGARQEYGDVTTRL